MQVSTRADTRVQVAVVRAWQEHRALLQQHAAEPARFDDADRVNARLESYVRFADLFEQLR